MHERFRPNTFERLAQGSEARLTQIEAARGICDDEILVLDNPQTTFLSRLKVSFSGLFNPVGRRVALPASAVLIAITAACSGGRDGNGERQVDTTGEFGRNLPAELFDACRAYVGNDEFGGEGDNKGYALANRYLEDNPTDSRALYLMGIGALFTAEFKDALPALIVVSGREDLPSEQAKLAEDMAKGILNAAKTDDIIERLNLIMEPETKIREDLITICPDGKADGAGVRSDESVISSEEAEIRGLIKCGLESDGGCLNRLLELHEKSLPIMLKEILSNDVEIEYIPSGTSRPIMNVLDLLTVTLYRLDENYPEEVNGVVDNIVSVLECLTVSPCNEIDIGSEKIKVEAGYIDSPIGRNSIAFLNTFAFYYYSSPAGKNFLLPHIDRLKSIQQWVEQRKSSTNEYGLISYDLIVLISDLQE